MYPSPENPYPSPENPYPYPENPYPWRAPADERTTVSTPGGRCAARCHERAPAALDAAPSDAAPSDAAPSACVGFRRDIADG